MPTLHCVLSAVQSFGVTEQVPLVQAPTMLLQPLPPQAVPFPTFASSQLPVPGLQSGGVWQSFCTHFTLFAVSATQVPPRHLSFGVHFVLSALQLAPSSFG